MKIQDIRWIIEHKIIHRVPRTEQDVYNLIKGFSGNIFIDIGCDVGIYSKLGLRIDG